MSKTPNLEQSLESLFDAERRVRELHGRISDGDPGAVLDGVQKALGKALAEADEDEASLRLERLAAILGELEGPRAVDLLIDILCSDLLEAREAAGAQLEGLAFDRFKEVARGIERALDRLPVGSPALPELPYLLAEIPEPGVVKLLGKFLEHQDADAVAAAIEVSVTIGDPAILEGLTRLTGDKRSVTMSDEEDQATDVTIGELAEDAIGLFEEAEDDEEPAPKRDSRKN